MEEKGNPRNHKESQESSPPHLPLDSSKANLQERGPRKGKKDHLKDKKKAKNHLKDHSTHTNHSNSSANVQLTSPENHQVSFQGIAESSKEMGQNISEEKLPFPLEKILKRPTYVTISNFNRICGTFGHATTYFKRPVLQGSFYIEYTFRQDKKKDKKVAFPPSIRIGLCVYGFNHSFPLGWEESLAYKSSDGSVVYRGQVVHSGQPYKVGDLIGVHLKMSPPYKHPDKTKVSEGSSVSFYKNGVHVYQFIGLKQTFYSFGVSLFNYSQAEIVSKPIKKIPDSTARHFFQSLNEPVPYKDLLESGIFKI